MSWLDKVISVFSGRSGVASAGNQPASMAAASAPLRREKSVVKPGQYVLHNGSIDTLDHEVRANIRIELIGCLQLKSLPAGLKTGTLDLTGCSALEQLPEGVEVSFLDLADCASLLALPDDLKLKGGRLNLRNCAKLKSLPDNMGEVAQLDLSGCSNITTIPQGLSITSWIDIGRSGIEKLPASLSHLSVRRDGLTIPPESIFLN